MGSTQSSSIQPYVDGSFSDQISSRSDSSSEHKRGTAEYLGGYLSTLEGKIKMQKTMFYFIYDGRLYRKRKETHSFESATIVCDLRICDINVCANKRANFRITTPAGHYFVFSAPDANDAARWVLILIEQAKHSLRRHGIRTTVQASVESGVDAHTNACAHSGIPDAVKAIMRANPECADCGQASPDWVSVNLGIMICVECAFIHQSLGSHISLPKNLILSQECWAPPSLQVLRDIGNERSNALWEYLASPRTKPVPTATAEVKEQWIYAKYVCHHFIDRYLTRNLSEDPSKYVFDAASRGVNVDILRGVAGGGNVHWRDGRDGSTVLHAAARHGHLATCQLLVDLKADPRTLNMLNQTPLDVAASAHARDFLRQLTKEDSGEEENEDEDDEDDGEEGEKGTAVGNRNAVNGSENGSGSSKAESKFAEEKTKQRARAGGVDGGTRSRRKERPTPIS